MWSNNIRNSDRLLCLIEYGSNLFGQSEKEARRAYASFVAKDVEI